jgi:hypothetical protein
LPESLEAEYHGTTSASKNLLLDKIAILANRFKMRTFDPTLTTTPAAVWIGLKLPPQNRSGAASSSLRLSFVLSHKSLSASQGSRSRRACRSLRLDQQPLSFVAVAASGEAHDDSVSPAFRLCPREHRPPPSTRDHRAQRSASTQGRYSPLLANHQ